MSDLINGDGYIVLEKIIPIELIDSINQQLEKLYPVRASSSNKQYAERDNIKNLPNISVWWSQMVADWPEVIEIEKILKPYILEHMSTAHMYASDIVTIEANSIWVSPHIDTPHRFKKYNYNKNLLGIQSIISLRDTDKDSASTGVLPGSQKQDYNINLCYQGYYNNHFLNKCVQPVMPKGSVLMYNCRLLHSSMPNPTNHSRPALLLNYLDSSIIEDIKTLDNIWSSNG